MAVTKLWPVKSNLGQVINYAANKEKTAATVYSEEQYQELRDVLSKSGQDMSLADAVMAAYNNEKETTKAAYINKYSN